MEAFFTMEGVLVVAVCTKKDYMAVALPEYPLADSCWVSSKFVLIYSVTFKHIHARFSYNMLDLVEVRLRAVFSGMCVIHNVFFPQHSVAIVHIPGRRPFGQNLVTIYIDGEQRLTAQLHFPSLSEVIESEMEPCGFVLYQSNVPFSSLPRLNVDQ